MGLFSLLGVMSPAHIGCVTICSRIFSGARLVGRDKAGNKYYRAKPRRGYKHERRWVIYKGVPEASAIPPEWHGWMHHQTDIVPDSETGAFRRPWQKPHRPNPTGTRAAYRPAGHILSGGRRPKATGDYAPWTPPE